MNPTIGAEVIRTGVVKKSAWQIRAFRYALVCEWIAEQLHSANSERAERTATKSAGNDELSERVKTLEIAARGNKPKSKRDRIRTQRLKFCVSRRKRGDTWEQICRDYLEAIRSRKTYIEDKKAHPDTLRQMCEQYHPELKR